MEMEPSNPLKEIFDELFGLLEPLETQSMALTQFLRDEKIGNDKKLAPYLEQVGNASSVKWPIEKQSSDKSATKIDDQADLVAASSGPSAKPAKKADPAPPRPGTKEKSKSEPKHK